MKEGAGDGGRAEVSCPMPRALELCGLLVAVLRTAGVAAVRSSEVFNMALQLILSPLLFH